MVAIIIVWMACIVASPTAYMSIQRRQHTSMMEHSWCMLVHLLKCTRGLQTISCGQGISTSPVCYAQQQQQSSLFVRACCSGHNQEPQHYAHGGWCAVVCISLAYHVTLTSAWDKFARGPSKVLAIAHMCICIHVYIVYCWNVVCA